MILPASMPPSPQFWLDAILELELVLVMGFIKGFVILIFFSASKNSVHASSCLPRVQPGVPDAAFN